MFPRVVEAFELYVLCRNQQLVPLELPKGKKTEYRIVKWTTGLSHLPWVGGMDDQPFRTMKFFHEFMRGDEVAASKALS